MGTFQQMALTAVRLYQRHLSPHKGFVCAYAVHTGRCGCSELGYRAIQRYGLAKGWQVLRLRMALCGTAHRRHAGARRRPSARERGDCDCNLPCDLNTPSASDGCDWSDAYSCGDMGNDSKKSDKARRSQRERDRNAHLPPFSNRRMRANIRS